MNKNELFDLINKTAQTLHSNEKLVLPLLAVKARKAAQALPTDIAISGASQVLTKMASTQSFISRAEFDKILNTFHNTTTKLNEVFAEELDKKSKDKPKTFERSENENKSIDKDYEKLANPVLSNALEGLFEGKSKIYSKEDAQKAEKACMAQLMSIGFEPNKVDVFAGKDNIIICQAVYETPKGKANVLVPVELVNGKALLPNMFLNKEGFVEITEENVDEHIAHVAGKSFKVDGKKLLEAVCEIVHGKKEPINEVELALIKLKGDSGQILDPSNSLYTEIIEPNQEDVKLPVSEDEETFASKLSKSEGIAKFIHGDRIVEAGRSVILRKLAEFGYRNCQIKVSDVEESKIFYSVGIGSGTGFKIFVEASNNMALPPKVIIADGKVYGFNKAAIDGLVKEGKGGDRRAYATASRSYGLKPSELVEIVKDSVKEGNLLKAEDAINVLSETDPAAHKIALAHFMMGIYEPGESPNDKSMRKIVEQPVKDVPQFMSYKIFFPEGA